MRLARLVLICCLAAILLPMPGLATAQEGTPPADPSRALSYIPDPSALGEGWGSVGDTVTKIQNTAVWEQVATAGFYGPKGQRVLLNARVVHPDREAIVKAEDVVDSLRSAYVYGNLFEDGTEIAGAAVPGCDQMVRVEGIDDSFFPAGFSACFIGLDVVLWVEVSGEFQGKTGTSASDAAIALMLQTAAS